MRVERSARRYHGRMAGLVIFISCVALECLASAILASKKRSIKDFSKAVSKRERPFCIFLCLENLTPHVEIRLLKGFVRVLWEIGDTPLDEKGYMGAPCPLKLHRFCNSPVKILKNML